MIQMTLFDLGGLHTNCYLLHDDDCGEAIMIDVGGAPAKAIDFLAAKGLRLTHIFNTHLHFDHVLGNAALAEATGAPIFASRLDDYLTAPEMDGRSFGLPPTPPFTYSNLDPGELSLLGVPCRILSTPGHTPGSLSFYFPKQGWVFPGDALFYRSIGRTDLPGGETQTLYDAIERELFALPATTEVHPGHGIPTVIGDEMHANPYVGKARR